MEGGSSPAAESQGMDGVMVEADRIELGRTAPMTS
jgi:hypothetical protein